MGVRLGEAIRADVPMDIEVSDHAIINKFCLHEIAGKRDALLLVQLARNGELDFAGKLRVLAQFSCFDLVPQSRTVAHSFGCAFGQQHFGMHDARLVGEVMIAVEPVIVQPLGRTIGSGRHRTRSGSA